MSVTELDTDRELARRIKFNTRMLDSVRDSFQALLSGIQGCVFLGVSRDKLKDAMKMGAQVDPHVNLQQCLAIINTLLPTPVPAPANANASEEKEEEEEDDSMSDLEDVDAGEVTSDDEDEAASKGRAVSADDGAIVKRELNILPIEADGTTLPPVEYLPRIKKRSFNLRVSFRRAKDQQTEGENQYDDKLVTADSPLDIARKKVLGTKLWKHEREKKANAQSYCPPDDSLRLMLAGAGVHATIFWAEYTEEEQKQVDLLWTKEVLKGSDRDQAPCGRYLLRISPRPKEVRNPMYRLKKGTEDWEMIEKKPSGFTWEIKHKDRFCIGGSFHFKVSMEPIETDTPTHDDNES